MRSDIFSVYRQRLESETTALVFVLYQWWGLWQEAWRLRRIRKDRGNGRPDMHIK